MRCFKCARLVCQAQLDQIRLQKRRKADSEATRTGPDALEAKKAEPPKAVLSQKDMAVQELWGGKAVGQAQPAAQQASMAQAQAVADSEQQASVSSYNKLNRLRRNPTRLAGLCEKLRALILDVDNKKAAAMLLERFGGSIDEADAHVRFQMEAGEKETERTRKLRWTRAEASCVCVRLGIVALDQIDHL